MCFVCCDIMNEICIDRNKAVFDQILSGFKIEESTMKKKSIFKSFCWFFELFLRMRLITINFKLIFVCHDISILYRILFFKLSV